MTDNILDELVKTEEESFEKILLALIDSKDIVMKTEISNVLAAVKLEMYAAWLEAEKMKKPAKLIRQFLLTYFQFMVSNKRKSREEVTKVLSAGFAEQEEQKAGRITRFLQRKVE